MEEKSSSRKRPLSLSDEEDSKNPQTKKRVRFPKGKKLKEVVDVLPDIIGAVEAPGVDLSDPKSAAKERAKRRSEMVTKHLAEDRGVNITDISTAEVNYEENADFVDDGIQLEPFNLDQEREEGYFDANGNFVEYARENGMKDAWLDSVEVDSRYVGRNSDIAEVEEETPDLSLEDVGKMKRRIADLLEPEETILQALRRLKGTSTDRKEKMPEEIKVMFDQLTEDSVKLMENGEYNVYHDKREVFEREAEGYERIARAKESISRGVDNIFSNGADQGVASSLLPGPSLLPSDLNASSSQNLSGNAADDFDMFAEDDEKSTSNQTANETTLATGAVPESQSLPSSESLLTDLQSGDAETDYIYDESSGYYYSSTLGYYYDPSSGLYCCANSGKWYSYNEQTSIYDEVQAEVEYPVA